MKKMSFSKSSVFNTMSFAPSKSIKKQIMAAALERFPQYEYKWVEGAMGLVYAPYKEASKTILRNRKNLTIAKKAAVFADNSTEVGKLLLSKGVEHGSEWRPCILDEEKAYHDAEDFSTKVFISYDGQIVSLDSSVSVYTSDYLRYGTTHCADFSIEGIGHVNQTIRGLIRRSWGDEAAEEFIATYENVETAA